MKFWRTWKRIFRDKRYTFDGGPGMMVVLAIAITLVVVMVMPVVNTTSNSLSLNNALNALTKYNYVAWAISGLSSGQVPYATGVNSLTSESGFEYNSTTNSLTVGGDNVTRAATFVIASTTSSGQADYYCDYSNDQIEIQAALDALPAAGGKVLLLEGDYKIEAPVTLTTYDKLHGSGKYATHLTNSSGDYTIKINTAHHIEIRDLSMGSSVGGVSWIGVTDSDMYSVTIAGCTDTGFNYDNGSWYNSFFDLTVTSITNSDNTGMGVNLGDTGNANGFKMIGGSLRDCNYNLYATRGTGHALFGVMLESGTVRNVSINTSARVEFHGCSIEAKSILNNGIMAFYGGYRTGTPIENYGEYIDLINDNLTMTGDLTVGTIVISNQSWGTSSIPNGATSVNVTHGLTGTPTQVTMAFKEKATNAPGDWWWTANSANVTYYVRNDPGGSNLDFAWGAAVR